MFFLGWLLSLIRISILSAPSRFTCMPSSHTPLNASSLARYRVYFMTSKEGFLRKELLSVVVVAEDWFLLKVWNLILKCPLATVYVWFCELRQVVLCYLRFLKKLLHCWLLYFQDLNYEPDPILRHKAIMLSKAWEFSSMQQYVLVIIQLAVSE